VFHAKLKPHSLLYVHKLHSLCFQIISRTFMHRIIRTKQSGQILGSVLCLMGFAALIVVFWKAWPDASSSANMFSALWLEILTQQINVASIIALKLIYLTVAGTVFLVLGIVVLVFSRQIFLVSSGSTLLQCPHCKNQWKAGRAMGWAECPYCRKFIHPQTMKKA